MKSERDLLKAGQLALEHNSSLSQVYVTKDGTPFGDKNSAVNHGHTLEENGYVIVSKEGVELSEIKEDGPALIPEIDLIQVINEEDTLEGIIDLMNGDNRPAIRNAGIKRIKELNQAVIDLKLEEKIKSKMIHAVKSVENIDIPPHVAKKQAQEPKPAAKKQVKPKPSPKQAQEPKSDQ